VTKTIASPVAGNTLEEFIVKAQTAPPSTIPPTAPLGGILSVNGTLVPSLNGAVLNVTALNDDTIAYIPKPGENNQYMMGMAGGGAINNYNWAPTISDNATDFLQLIQWLDDILLKVLFQGYEKFNGGQWGNVYPKTIVQSIGSMAAQAYVHRGTATDSLQHYGKSTMQMCQYNLPTFSPDDFLHVALTLLLLQIGVLLDAISSIAVTDPWLVPCIATSLGAKSRMTAVVNMMQNHIAAAAPREVAIPGKLVYSYAVNNYSPQCPQKLPWGDAIPPLTITSTTTQPGSKRPVSVIVALDPKTQSTGQLYLAWMGPWGDLKYSPIGSDGSAAVPADLYGHVWIVVTNAQDVKLKELPRVAVAGPQMIWISQP
jgi:hypothetical protein